MRLRSVLVLLLALTAPVAGCSDDATTTPDASTADVLSDVATDTASDVVTDTAADVLSDVVTDTASDVVTDTASDVATDTASDAATDVVRDTATDTAGDVVTDTASDAATDIASDAAADAPADVANDGSADGGSLAASCTASGGTVSTALCCAATSDFPNTCATGACGCAPMFSRSVMTCACPAGLCFDGTRCVAR